MKSVIATSVKSLLKLLNLDIAIAFPVIVHTSLKPFSKGLRIFQLRNQEQNFKKCKRHSNLSDENNNNK